MRSWTSGAIMRHLVRDRWKTGGANHRQQQAGKLVDRHGADLLGIEPRGLGIERILFGEIHYRVGAVDAFERKGVDQFLARHSLAIVLGRPAQQAQKIDEGVRQKAGVAIGGDADHRAVLALGKLGAIGRHQQRQVREFGRRRAGGFENQHVLERIGDVVLAANDVADAQVRVVGAGGQVIGRHAVAAQQGEIFDIGGGFGLRPVNAVGEANVPLGVARHAETQRKRLAGGGAAVAFLARHLAHSALNSQPRGLSPLSPFRRA